MTTCPKCGATSGNDWSQCKGSCPLPGSPHHKPEQKRRVINAAEALYCVRETVMQSGYYPKEIVQLLKIVQPDWEARLNGDGEIEILAMEEENVE
ncbi:hypothetical protein IVB12_15690 [Bradyrhizobium sp. 179]|uniref:hypothetical protein n=1 Tax=Bradyrhizobium sp. 179 TaxID=2782648 RepID=UPI001FF8BA5C|nr:hypothetical protein [Bradyrhizobium sp. 179]MCK1543358.1 hypothetical protein [Bradyrhizobium sp. 179]